MKKNNNLFKVMLFLLSCSVFLLLSGARRQVETTPEITDAQQVAVEITSSFPVSGGSQNWHDFAMENPIVLINICAEK